MIRFKTAVMPDKSKLNAKVQRVQRFVDSEVLRRCDPLVPKKSGILKRSGIERTKIGSGVVRYYTPYARYQYYKGRVSVTRGRKWFQRMKSEQGQAILNAAQRMLKGD